jgi:uncharacterized membrane protein
MKRQFLTETIILFLLGLQGIASFLLYPRLPDRLPTHWNIHGQVDGTMSKMNGLLVSLGINLGLYVLLLAIPYLDPKKKMEQFRETYGWIRLSMHIFMALLFVAMMAYSLGYKIPMDRIVPALVSILIIILGNLMGKMRPNYFVGIRTHWTLENPAVWQKTHRISGPIWVAAGLLGLVGSLFGGSWAFGLLFFPLTLAVAFSIGYSWYAFKMEKPYRSRDAG